MMVVVMVAVVMVVLQFMEMVMKTKKVEWLGAPSDLTAAAAGVL